MIDDRSDGPAGRANEPSLIRSAQRGSETGSFSGQPVDAREAVIHEPVEGELDGCQADLVPPCLNEVPQLWSRQPQSTLALRCCPVWCFSTKSCMAR